MKTPLLAPPRNLKPDLKPDLKPEIVSSSAPAIAPKELIFICGVCHQERSASTLRALGAMSVDQVCFARVKAEASFAYHELQRLTLKARRYPASSSLAEQIERNEQRLARFIAGLLLPAEGGPLLLELIAAAKAPSSAIRVAQPGDEPAPLLRSS